MNKIYTPADRAEFRPLTYLACPYSDPDPKVRAERARQATRATARLVEKQGWNVFSPITHSHPLHLEGLDGTWEFWKKIDIEYLRISERVVVLDIPGWDKSTGVTAEIKLADQMGIPVVHILPEAEAAKDDTTNPKDLIGDRKPRIDLVPSSLTIRVAKVMELGARKYGPYNWRTKKVRLTVYAAAAMRHLMQLIDGETVDPESGQPHSAHAAACMGIILDAEATGSLIDDRPAPGPAGKLIEQLTEKKQ